MSRHLPNLLSALRLLAAPLAAFLIVAGDDLAALLVFALAGASDAADGFIARRWGHTSRFGAWLDPAADKLLMLACLVALYRVGAAPLWLTALVVGRDLSLGAGAVLAKGLSLPLHIAPIRLGKASTLMQIVYVGLLLLLLAVERDAPGLMMAAAIVTAGVTILSWLAYVQIFLRVLVPGRRTA
jgi:cardiolipin synthase